VAEPFTIRIFVPDGDPEGTRLIDRMNWTGKGVVFPRTKWLDIRKRSEFNRGGVYILSGWVEDDLPTLYIGQGEEVRSRIESHHQNKDFWDRGIVFISTGGGLNRAHLTWLEYALIERAGEMRRCHLDNGNAPQEPALTEAEKADTQGFLREILQILPLVGLHVFESAKPVALPRATSAGATVKADDHKPDTVIVPAQKDGFEKVFLGENCWYSIRISPGMLDKIRFVAVYQAAPVAAITHYAPVDRIEPYGESGKYKLVFSEKPKLIGPIPLADASPVFVMGPKYTSFEKLKVATKISDLVGKN